MKATTSRAQEINCRESGGSLTQTAIAIAKQILHVRNDASIKERRMGRRLESFIEARSKNRSEISKKVDATASTLGTGVDCKQELDGQLKEINDYETL